MQNMPGFVDDERHFLYKEYLKIIAEHRPPVFVMENVKGLLSATHNGESMIQMIWKDLRNPRCALGTSGDKFSEYKLHGLYCPNTLFGSASKLQDFLVKSELHGIPQTRHRVFVLGIRSDLNITPAQLTLEEPPTVEQTIGHLPKIRSGVTDEPDTSEAWISAIFSLKKIDFGSHTHADAIRGRIDTLFKSRSNTFRRSATSYPPQPSKTGGAMAFMYDPRVRTLTGHDARAHMTADLQRYAFATAFAHVTGRSPKLLDFPQALLPNHRDIEDGVAGKKFVDRFKVQLPKRSASTITAHIAKDGHYYIHYDLE